MKIIKNLLRQQAIMLLLVMLMAPTMMLWAQEMNEKFAMTTQMFLNELKEQKANGPRRAPVRHLPDGTKIPKQRRLIASPDTIGGVVYISCFIHLKDVSDLSTVRSLGVEIEETFDGMDFITARVPVNQLQSLADIDNVTRIKVAQQMRPLTDVAKQQTNVDDLLTLSTDAQALGVTSKYDGTGVVLGIIDTGIDFQHIAFKDKDGNSRIKRAYVYTGSGSGTEYTSITSTAPTTDNNAEDHGTHTATTAGGSSVIVSGNNVTVTDNHANATYSGMAPGADLYLAGINGLSDTYLTNALTKIVQYADAQQKPLVVSNSWGSGWGPRDGTGELANLVGTYFGDSHPNHIILFAASNDAGHRTGNEGGGFFVKKNSASSSSPLGTIIRTDGVGGEYYGGLMACAWASSKLNCKIYVLDNSTGAVKTYWTVTQNNTQIFSGLDNYYNNGTITVYIEYENGKYRLAVYSENGIESTSSNAYTLAIEVYPASGSTDVNMWAGDWSYFTNHLTTSSHIWTAGTDDMCVSDEATIPNAISVGAYVSKTKQKNYLGTNYNYNTSGTLGDIAVFSSYATASQSPTGQAYPWITAPGAQVVAGVNHYHTTSINVDSYFHSDNKSSLVVNDSANPYGVMQGTSMATPVAAGIVALWLQAAQSVNKDLTVNDVKDIMELTAITDSYTTTGTNASHFGKGKIDALAGIQYILSTGGPVIKATPTSIDFADKNPYATLTYTKTLNVKGFNLEGNITATLTDANGVYSLNQTTITQSEATDGVDITITYAPLSAGMHNATITLSASNADNVVVNLTATAQAATPTIITDPEELTFSANQNEQKSLTFDVLSEFLTGDVSVILTDENGVFSIDKTSITKTDSEEGATVTVTFQSAVPGTYTGNITLSSAGADPVTVSLTGTVIASNPNTKTFKLVTSTNDLESGMRYIIACGSKSTAAGSLDNNILAKVDVTVENNVITIDDNVAVFVLEGDQTNGWTFKNESTNTYLYATAAKNLAYSSSEKTWTLSNTTAGVIMAYDTYGTMLYNVNSPRFTTYTSDPNANMIQANLYMEYSDNPTDPTIAYYKNADGMKGSELKTAMCGIIYNRTEKSYDYLWTAFATTDVRNDGKIWDMYSNITNYEPGGSAQGASTTEEGVSYNREHSFPKSWFGGEVMPMYTDLHHLYPVDGFVNNKHSNNPFGETDGDAYKSANDFSKLGDCTYPGYTGKVFEPADEYKGDFARTYFYMVTCYEEKLPDWYTNYGVNNTSSSTTETRNAVLATLDGNKYPGLTTWQLQLLMEWAKNDPVSEKEVNRNNAVYAIQNNRNPFIDYPGLEEYIWGSMKTTAFDYDDYVQPVYSTPVTVPELTITDVTATTALANWTVCDGETEYTLQLASDNQFTGGYDNPVTLVENAATSTTAPTDWTYNIGNTSGSYLQLFSGHYVITEVFDASACSELSLSLYMRTYGGTGQPSITVQYSTDNGATWSESLGTLYAANTTMAQRTLDIFEAVGNASVRLRIASTSTSSSVGVGIKDIVISGIETTNGSLISSITVTDGTSYTFNNLTPETTYYARVKGNDDWSNVANFTTNAAADFAPVWSDIPAKTVYLGEDVDITISDYVTGKPAPTIELTSTTANANDYEFEDGLLLFEPSASGSYTFTFTATNSEGNAEATFTIEAVGEAPKLTASLGTSLNAYVGETVEFTVTATGHPTPTVEMTNNDYGATFNNGNFSFIPSATGTYTFTFTAENSVGTDNLTVTITVTLPPITIPTLTVTDITATTADVSWTACDGVSSYTIQLASDKQFTTGGSGNLSENFDGFSGNGSDDISGSLDDYTATTGWTGYKVYCNSGMAKIGASSGQGWLMTPALNASGTLTIVWSALRYGTSDKSTLLLGISENGTDFDEETITIEDEIHSFTNTFTVSGPTVYVRWMASGSSKARFYLDDITISSGGSLIATETVTGTSHTFNSLAPGTTYYARVKGNAEWSDIEKFQTTPVPITLTDNANNTSDIEENDGNNANITLSGRTLWMDGYWNTLCLPFDLGAPDASSNHWFDGTPLEGATVMTLANSPNSGTGFDATTGTLTLYFVDVDRIEAGVPYIIRWGTPESPAGGTISDPVFTGVTIDKDLNNVTFPGGAFQGTYDHITWSEENQSILFLGDNNKLFYPQPSGDDIPNIGACRAYFELSEPTLVREFVLHFGDNGEQTNGIVEAEANSSLSTHSSLSGWFTLDGRKLNGMPTRKGLYIYNGNKTVIK